MEFNQINLSTHDHVDRRIIYTVLGTAALLLAIFTLFNMVNGFQTYSARSDYLSKIENVQQQAKAFAEANNISLSRLIEFMLAKVVDKKYRSLDELPVSDWVNEVAEGEATYVRKNAAERNVKKDYLASRRK